MTPNTTIRTARTAARRTAAALAVAAVLLLTALVAPASADDVEVTGEWTATGQLLSGAGCQLFHQIVDGSGDWSPLGPVTLHLDFCLGYPGGEYYPAYGTFSVTPAGGGLGGELTGVVLASTLEPEGFPLHIDLVVTGGTGDLAGATGTLVLDGWFGYGALTAFGTVSGTLSVPDPMPATIDDCKDGGWTGVVDDQGRPFRNQGACVAWVSTPR